LFGGEGVELFLKTRAPARAGAKAGARPAAPHALLWIEGGRVRGGRGAADGGAADEGGGVRDFLA
jgi:hypothetical protein